MILIPESGCAVVKSQGNLGNARLNAHLREIKDEMATEKPDTGKVRRAVASIVRIAEGAGGGLIRKMRDDERRSVAEIARLFKVRTQTVRRA